MRSTLRLYDSFRNSSAFQSPKVSDEGEAKVEISDIELPQTTATPEEAIQQSESQI